jgi:hypothetical protein
VRRGQLHLKGRPASGGEIEVALERVFGQRALRTYQLVAANDWIDRVAAGALKGAQAQPTTVGAVMRSERALAIATLLGINRPAYLVPSVQGALDRVGAVDEDRLLGELRREALTRYRPGERRRRAMRFITGDAAW